MDRTIPPGRTRHCAHHLRMRLRILLTAFWLLALAHAATAQTGTQVDAQQVEYYRDYAVITTTCQTWDEAQALVARITERGGTVSIMLSPQRFLGWVPEGARPAVEQLDRIALVNSTTSMNKQVPAGPYADDERAGLEHYIAAKTGMLPQPRQNQPEDTRISCLSPTDERALPDMLGMLGRMTDSLARVENVATELWQGRMRDSVQSLLGIPRGLLYGIINAEVFLLESTGAGATDSWTVAQEMEYITQIFRGFDFLSRGAAIYGRALTFRCTFYRPSTSTVVRVTGEPINFVQANDWQLVRQVMRNLGYENPFGDPGWGWVGAILTLGACIPCDLAAAWGVFPDGTEKEFIRVMKWNDRRTEELRVDQSISLFVKLVPPGRTHRAYARAAGTGYVGGQLVVPELGLRIDLPNMIIGPFTMLSTEETAPVIAHEVSHLFGAPDEYREAAGDMDCPQAGYNFRGAANHNCEVSNRTSVRALMRNNTDLNITNMEFSSATPVHVGWTPGPARTIRFRTVPAGIPITMPLWFESGPTFSDQRDLFLGVGYTIPNVSVPAFFDIGSTRYYFDAWYENVRPSGASTRSTWGATRSIRIDNTVNEYVAQYTTTGGGITTANSTLEARFGMQGVVAGSSGRLRLPGIVLVWRSTLTSGGSYVVQQFTSGAWNDIPNGSYIIGVSSPGYYYANLSSLSTGANTPYRLRVIPVSQAGARGTPSNEATITTRANGIDSYAYDANEPNDSPTSATTISFNAASDTAKTVNAAITYLPQEEFGFYFDADHYAVNASSIGTWSLRVTITTRSGSVFEPYITYRPSPGAAPVEARRAFGGGWYFDVTRDGTTTFTVTSRRATSDLVDMNTSVGNWGEYVITVRAVPPMLSGIDRLCPDCRSIGRVPMGGGRIYPFGTAITQQRIFTQAGLPVPTSMPYGFVAEADPGFQFTGWEGDFAGTKNPDNRTLDPKLIPPGDLLLLAKFTPLPQGQYELVYETPEAWKSVLGESRRIRGGMGDEIDLELPEAAMNGFDFLGWGGTLTAADVVSPSEWKVSPRIRVKLTRHLLVKPTIVPRPCSGSGPAAFTHTLLVTTAASDKTTLTYGMQPNAGDGLEAGQSELPPLPPTPVHDARFLGIAGAAQGSLTDIRALKTSHTFIGSVQPGDNGNPVLLSWAPIPSTTPGTFVLTIGSDMVNMRSTTSYRGDLGSSSSFTIRVEQDTCRTLPAGEFTVAVSDVDASNFPFVRGRVCVTDKQGNPIMTVRPADVMLLEKKGNERAPGILRDFRPADDCYVFEGFIDNSVPQDDKNKTRGIILVVGLQNPRGQDDGDATITLPVPDPGPETGNDNGKPNTAYDVQHGSGWQLVSMPIMLTDTRVASVFGDGSVRSPLYAFDPDLGYRTADAMAFGKGYWLRFAAGGSRTVSGLERTIFDVSGLPGVGQAAANGWNLIGGISYDVPLASITQTPSNAIISIFEYDNGYKPPTVTLKRGKGYWVKLQPSSTLRIVRSFTGDGGYASKSTTFTSEHERVLSALPRTIDITAIDAAGAASSLFLTPQAVVDQLDHAARQAAELPPTPPSTAFDARFAGDLAFAADLGTTQLRLQGAAPWRLDIAPSTLDGRIDLSEVGGSHLGSVDVRTGGTIVIPQPADGSSLARVVLHRSAAAEPQPTAFALGQNYPNPFAAGSASASATVIGYDVADAATVELVVYDMLGRAVRTLVSGIVPAGRHTALWNGLDDAGRAVPAGTYIYELRAGDIRLVRHLTIVR